MPVKTFNLYNVMGFHRSLSTPKSNAGAIKKKWDNNMTNFVGNDYDNRKQSIYKGYEMMTIII